MYTVFVDESGDAGIANIRSEHTGGASEYMTLGAVLVPNSKLDAISEQLNDLTQKFGKRNLHCNRLNHMEKVKYSQILASNEVICFGLISKKETLREYKDNISSDAKKYYNKCAKYLLECIGHFIEHYDYKDRPVEIIMEEGNFEYQKLKNYIKICQQTPHNERAKFLRFIDSDKIISKEKSEQSLLQLADLVAHALYKTVTKDHGNIEPRYLHEMKNRFFHDKITKEIVGYGIKVIHELSDIDDFAADVYRNLRFDG